MLRLPAAFGRSWAVHWMLPTSFRSPGQWPNTIRKLSPNPEAQTLLTKGRSSHPLSVNTIALHAVYSNGAHLMTMMVVVVVGMMMMMMTLTIMMTMTQMQMLVVNTVIIRTPMPIVIAVISIHVNLVTISSVTDQSPHAEPLCSPLRFAITISSSSTVFDVKVFSLLCRDSAAES